MKKRASGMTYVEAALTVLEAHEHPLTTREIFNEAIQCELLKPTGKTPLASMSAELYTFSQTLNGKRLVRLSEHGKTRARRGSVRWTLRDVSIADTS